MQSLMTKKEGTHEIDNAYEKHYQNKNSNLHIYPVEFVVRIFLGTYPKLNMDRNSYQGSHLLDIGFGDGRNFPLLRNLGFHISGVEISDNIVQIATQKFNELNISTDLRLGRNSCIPFEDHFFNYVLACHSIYYVDPGETFSHNLAEIARVMRTNGILIASLPRPTASILKNAKLLADGHVEITQDPLALRNGSIFRVFSTELEIKNTFSPYFDNFVIGSCDDDFFGIQQNVWIVVCSRK